MAQPLSEVPLDLTVPEAVVALRRKIGASLYVCILGLSAPLPADPGKLDLQCVAKELARALSAASFGAGRRVVFLTGGRSGVQEIFAKHCRGKARAEVWNLVPQGHRSGYGVGNDIHVGMTAEQRNSVFRQLGDIHVAVGGGLDVALDVKAATANGAAVFLVGCGAGDACDKLDIPSSSLVRPFFVSKEQWAKLANARVSQEAAVDASEALVLAIGDYLRLHPDMGGFAASSGSGDPAVTTLSAPMLTVGKKSAATGNPILEQWVASFYRGRSKAWPIRSENGGDLSGARHVDMWSPGCNAWRRNPDLEGHHCM